MAFSQAGSAPPGDIIASQEARTLFQLVGDLRAKGGMCLSTPMAASTPLSFHPGLQAAAERDAAAAVSKGGFGIARGVSPERPGEVFSYPGPAVAVLTGISRSSARAMLDVWMLDPTRCSILLAPEYRDAGVAHVNGHWVLLLGRH